jgi:hypothetical protein
MLAQCAALEAQRQGREDGLVGTVTQISSAALLAVPGVIFASSVHLPRFAIDPCLYLGLILFAFALLAAMAEQYFSGLACSKQVDVVRAYYLKRSSEIQDKTSVRRVRVARYISFACFGVALIVTALGLLRLEAIK